MTQQQTFTIKQWEGEPDVLQRYAALLSSVYQKDISPQYMEWKHARNPLKPSLIAYAENDAGEMVAARAFWPMFSTKQPIYQPCDTVTRGDFQRRGLFSSLTKLCLSHVESNASIVNFPNNNSYPAYLKLGWKCYAQNKRVFGLSLLGRRQRIRDLGHYLEQRVSPERLLYLKWRYSSASGVNYRFFEHESGFIVSNGQTQGLVSLQENREPFGKTTGFSQGYVLPNFYSSLKRIFTGTLALPCSSRTAFYLLPAASKDTLEQAFSMAQVNTLMDTF